ncbi:MAG: RDD family protein [Lentisphaeria bacterium]|nr:RDD family protein [Lentisphaeria bacterium]
MPPITLKNNEEDIYAGFWKRLGSYLLDILIWSPYIYFLVTFINAGRMNFLYTFIPSQALYFFYYFYGVSPKMWTIS